MDISKEELLRGLQLTTKIAPASYGCCGTITVILSLDGEFITSCDIDGSDIEDIMSNKNYI